MTQQHRFLVALRALQRWHADSVKARVYGAGRSPAAEHAILVPQRYPRTREWLERWRYAKTDDHREELVEAVEAEFGRLSCRPPMVRCVDFWRNAKWHRADEKCSICSR